MSRPFAVVSLKAYGDFVIALHSLNSPPDGRGASLLAGAHLKALHEALRPSPPTEFLQTSDHSIPAFYDVRRCGVRAGIRSAFEVRASLRRSATLRAGHELLWDRLGARERFLTLGIPTTALPTADNIYLAYREALQVGVESPAGTAPPASMRRVGIFPGSRLPRKTMTRKVIATVVATCRSIGTHVSTYVLDGEAADLPPDVQATAVPRCLAAMVEAVAGCDAVISADSLPAHLAEYHRRPVFVVSPEPNPYWLPLSSFNNDHWRTFANLPGSDARLIRFLTGQAPAA